MFRSYRSELANLRATRNFLAHRPKVHNEHFVEPSQSAIELLSSVIKRVKKPARELGVPINKIMYRSMSDRVIDAMREMQEQVFTCVLILENGVVVGAFSENSIFSYLVDDSIIEIEDDTTFFDIKDYLVLERPCESYRFLHKDITAMEVQEVFDKALQNNDRIGMIFFTEKGNKKEKLLSILTAWDLASF